MTADPSPVRADNLPNTRVFERIVRRCLSKRREDRWQHIDDLRSELEWVLDTLNERQVRDLFAYLRSTQPLVR